ncbi:DUF192 domain-containing protein [Methylomonas sp. LL1]|uniref:DUF192 domain-containing protein n=1 Tax=Methylomonas sp. LL1 TaxID=2785785 RepID=UPI0018C37E83|nr:DUF192 domain-containing protein [Methylomonas sp. LL1]QPK62981.1 DUF192 domain-containing protein [Methylomonas sp. LL1]
MNTQLTALMGGLILLLAALTAQSSPATDTKKWGLVTLAEDYRLDVEIVDTQTQRALGLMYRTQLAENQGMLFVYPDEAMRGVWMKNTLLALDVLFLSEDGRIVNMLHNLSPCAQTPCPAYSSETKARYMLEVNAGFIERHQLKIDQAVIIEPRHTEPGN